MDGNDDEWVHMRPIGHIESWFRTKNGTPRQGSIMPGSRGRLILNKSYFNNPHHSLDGLAAYTHLWIIFVFHKNQNKHIKAKVRPPCFDGQTVGVFASRSPHRPNPIGLTLSRIEQIDGDKVHLTGLDLLDGTPVLDIKPYISSYDEPGEVKLEEGGGGNDQEVVEDELKTVAESNNDYRGLATATTTAQPTTSVGRVVELQAVFTPRALSQLAQFHPKSVHEGENCNYCLEYLSNWQAAKSAIEKVLAADPRSVYRRQNCEDRLYYLTVDNIHITCWFENEENLVEVVKIKHIH